MQAAIEGLQANFRELRQRLARGGDVAALRQAVRDAKATHLRLVAALEARDLCCAARGHFFNLMLATDWLAETGHSRAVGMLLQRYPELRLLVDPELWAAERTLVECVQRQQLEPVLAWCRRNRSALRRAGGDLELRFKVLRAVQLARRGEARALETLLNARDAPGALLEHAALLISTLYLPAAALSGAQSGAQTADQRIDAEFGVSVAEFRASFRRVHGLPQHSPLLDCVVVGLALLKTKQCRVASGGGGSTGSGSHYGSSDDGSSSHYDGSSSSSSSSIGRSAQIEAVLHSTPTRCPVCLPYLAPISAFVPLAETPAGRPPQALVRTPGGFVLSFVELERYMQQLWPDVYAQNQFYDIDGELREIDSLKPVYA